MTLSNANDVLRAWLSSPPAALVANSGSPRRCGPRRALPLWWPPWCVTRCHKQKEVSKSVFNINMHHRWIIVFSAGARILLRTLRYFYINLYLLSSLIKFDHTQMRPFRTVSRCVTLCHTVSLSSEPCRWTPSLTRLLHSQLQRQKLVDSWLIHTDPCRFYCRFYCRYL